jgi:adhesin transport system membrane fusion protein
VACGSVSGWPSIAVGTFGGVVKVVDPSATYKGKFRVIIVPEEDEVWP